MVDSNKQNYKKLNPQYIQEILSKLTKEQNIIKWDIGASSSIDQSVQVDNGIAKQMKAAQRSSITLRVWNEKGLVGITSTSDISEFGLKKAISGAKNASLYGNPNDIPDFSKLAKKSIDSQEYPIKQHKKIQNLLNILIEAESELMSKHEAIQSVPYNGLGESFYERLYINSDNASRYMNRNQSSIYLYARAQENGRKPRSSGAVRLALASEDLDIKGCVEESSSKTISHLDYQQIETNKYLVCFSPEAFLDLILAFSSIFNARSIIDGVSLSKPDSIGKLISVPFFNLYDDALHPGNISSTPFDGEGTPTKRLCLIKDGVIENFLHSEATARKFNVDPTGHAGIGSKVSVGPDWLHICKSANNSIQSSNLSHKVYNNNFIIIEGLNALHAGVKPSQGSFSLPFDGWLINNGEKKSIEAATVAGDIRQLLKNIVNVEDQEFITHQGVSPHIWVDDLSITGEA